MVPSYYSAKLSSLFESSSFADSSPKKNFNTSSIVNRDRRSAILQRICGYGVKSHAKVASGSCGLVLLYFNNGRVLPHAPNSTQKKLSIGRRHNTIRFMAQATHLLL